MCSYLILWNIRCVDPAPLPPPITEPRTSCSVNDIIFYKPIFLRDILEVLFVLNGEAI